MIGQKTKVVIVQNTVRQYRAKFYLDLHERLAQDGIALRVVYSDPNPWEAEKRDCVDLNGRVGIKVHARWQAGDYLVYQHAWRHWKVWPKMSPGIHGSGRQVAGGSRNTWTGSRKVSLWWKDIKLSRSRSGAA